MLESLRVLVCSCLFLSVLIYAVVRLNWRQAPKVTQECRRTQRKSDQDWPHRHMACRGAVSHYRVTWLVQRLESRQQLAQWLEQWR